MKSNTDKRSDSHSQASVSRLQSVYSPLTTLCLLFIVFLSCCPKLPRIYIRPGPGLSDLKRIAVLPLDNLSGEEEAAEQMTEIFAMELMRTGRFDVAEPGLVKKAVKERRIRTTRDIDLEAAKWLGDNLDLNLILVGSVLDFEVQESQNKPVPVVTVILRLVQTNTGTTLWATYASRKGDDRETLFGWGRITSLPELAKEVASEMISTLRME